MSSVSTLSKPLLITLLIVLLSACVTNQQVIMSSAQFMLNDNSEPERKRRRQEQLASLPYMKNRYQPSTKPDLPLIFTDRIGKLLSTILQEINPLLFMGNL